MARCRSCEAPVVWAKTQAGKMMPLDATDSGDLAEFSDGNIVLVNGLIEVTADGLYKSHFATCPNATSHRRKG